MNKSFLTLLVFLLLQLLIGCARYHNDRFPSSDEMSNEETPRCRFRVGSGGAGGR